MKKIIIGLVLLLQSCVSNSTIESIKVGQKYERGENPFERDTLEIIAIKDGYAQYSINKKGNLESLYLGTIAYYIECEYFKLITEKTNQ